MLYSQNSSPQFSPQFPSGMCTPLQLVLNTFNNGLGQHYNTRLLGGFDEPEYLPARNGQAAEIRFREDYLASALHEVAHWCLAGRERRQLHDFGYWYRPEGRNAEEQQAFERAEVRPQAVEWLFARACGQRFTLSRDNHGPAGQQSDFAFAAAVSAQAHHYCRPAGLPPRARQFAAALAQQFGTPVYLDASLYTEESLR